MFFLFTTFLHIGCVVLVVVDPHGGDVSVDYRLRVDTLWNSLFYNNLSYHLRLRCQGRFTNHNAMDVSLSN